MVLYFSKMSEHYELGKKGEQLAVDYLTKEGYKRYRNQFGRGFCGIAINN